MNRLFVSASCQARLDQAWQAFSPAIRRGEAIIIGSSRPAIDDFLRSHCPDDHGVAGVHRFTLGQFAAALASPALLEHELAPVSRLGREALAARAVFDLRKDSALEYFGPVSDTPGFAAALASTLDELRLAGVTPAHLRSRSKAEADLAKLLDRYESELAAGLLADFATVLKLAVSAEANPFRELPLLLLDVQPRLSLDVALIQRAIQESRGTIATSVEKDEESISALARMLGTPPAENTGFSGTALDRVRRCIFSVEEPEGKAADDSVTIFSAAGEGLECVEIARRVLRMAGQGIPFDRIAVLLREPDAYVPLLEDAFRRAQIPVYITGGVLRPDPAGRALLALLECASERLSASKFAEYLSLGQVPALDVNGQPKPSPVTWVPSQDELQSTPETGEAAGMDLPEEDDWQVPAGSVPSPAGWEKLLVDAAVIGGGYDRWQRRLKGLEQEFRLRLAEVRGHDDAMEAHLGRQLDRLRGLSRFALPLIRRLDNLPRQDAWGVWLRHITELAQVALREPDSVLSVISELEPMREIGPVSLDEVCLVLSERLRFLRKPPDSRRFGRVFVGAIEDAMTRPFDVVFVPGLAEGLFPRKPFEDPLLLDSARETLHASLPVMRVRVARERLLLRIAAGAARFRFLVSYPRLDQAQGRPRVPSFYALEITRAVEGLLPDFREVEQRAAVSTTARLGWPAPRDAGEAIDDAEHDLALLEPLLRLPPSETRGHARYLLQSNPFLARALRSRRERWLKDWSAADGVVTSDEKTLAALAPNRLSDRDYSASSLQLFSSCPYRFFLHAIQGLRPREEKAPLEQMDPLTRGALFHTVQFRFFREAQERGWLPLRDKLLAWSLDLLDHILDSTAKDYEEKLAPAIHRVWRTEIDNLRADLRAWLIDSIPDQVQWTPWRFELGFGLTHEGEHDPESRRESAQVLPGLRLRGSIDLVESNGALLRVTDHKTGRPQPVPAYIGGGEVLQPVLYAMAAEAIFQKPVESGRLYYCTQRGAYSRGEIALSPRARMEVERLVREIDGSIRNGFLPAAPKQGACEYCDYRVICGPYEQERARRKDPDPLDELMNIRNAP